MYSQIVRFFKQISDNLSISDPAFFSQYDYGSQLCTVWSEEDIPLFLFQGSVWAVWHVFILISYYQIYSILYLKLQWYEFQAI